MRAKCPCGQPAIGVVIAAGAPLTVCQDCYRAACEAFAATPAEWATA